MGELQSSQTVKNEPVGVDLPEAASLQNQLDRKQRRFRLEPGHPFLAYSLNRVILSVYAVEIAAWTLSGENRAPHVHWHYRFGNPANPCRSIPAYRIPSPRCWGTLHRLFYWSNHVGQSPIRIDIERDREGRSIAIPDHILNQNTIELNNASQYSPHAN